jgi:hypothetical protein
VTERPVWAPNGKGAAMPTQTIPELLQRAARVHQAAMVEIATCKRLRAESKALLRLVRRVTPQGSLAGPYFIARPSASRRL